MKPFRYAVRRIFGQIPIPNYNNKDRRLSVGRASGFDSARTD